VSGNHFSPVAGLYAAFRPRYPEALFDWLAGLAPQREFAWDCGAGSGQATEPLAARFKHVIASDLSAAQLDAAPRLANVEYRVAPAGASGIPENSCDLVTVAQALHWFDLPEFYAEVKRVLKPQGVFAAWGYNLLRVEDDAIQALLERFYTQTVGPWWPPQRAHIENGYRDLPFPFVRIAAPAFALQQDWTLEHLLGYLRSWSAVARFQAANGYNPVAGLGQELARYWPQDKVLRIEWPLFIHAGRVP